MTKVYHCPAIRNRADALKAELAPFLLKAEKTIRDLRELSQKLSNSFDWMKGASANLDVQVVAQQLWLDDIETFYEGYLKQSILWQIIRREVLIRDGHRCVADCGRKATTVHHQSYEYKVMAGLDDSQLVSLCERCHTLIHYYKNGNKRPREEWPKVLQCLKDLSHKYKQKDKERKTLQRKTSRLVNQLRRFSNRELTPDEEAAKLKIEYRLYALGNITKRRQKA